MSLNESINSRVRLWKINHSGPGCSFYEFYEWYGIPVYFPVKHSALSGAHHLEPATTPYFCHGVFTDRSIFSLKLSRIQIPKGTSVTNCNQTHGLMSTCRHDVDMFTWDRIVLSSPKRARLDWNCPISREKYLKIDWSVKMPLHWLIMGVAGS